MLSNGVGGNVRCQKCNKGMKGLDLCQGQC